MTDTPEFKALMTRLAEAWARMKVSHEMAVADMLEKVSKS